MIELEMFTRIASARVVLVDNGQYRVADLFVSNDDGRTLFAKLENGSFAKLAGYTSSVASGLPVTSVQGVKWDRIAGIAYQQAPDGTSVEWVQPADGKGWDVILDQRQREEAPARQQTTLSDSTGSEQT